MCQRTSALPAKRSLRREDRSAPLFALLGRGGRNPAVPLALVLSGTGIAGGRTSVGTVAGALRGGARALALAGGETFAMDAPRGRRRRFALGGKRPLGEKRAECRDDERTSGRCLHGR